MKKITLLTISFLLAMAVIVSNGFSWPQGKNKNCPNQGGHMHQGGPMHKNCGQNQGSHPGIGQGYHGQGHMHNGWGQKLSQDQKDQLKALHQQFIDENVETRTTIANLYNEMRMEMKTSAPDREKLLSLAKRLEPLKMEMLTKRIDFQLEAKKIAPDFIPGFFMGRGHGCGSHGNKRGICPNWQEDAPRSLNHPSQE